MIYRRCQRYFHLVNVNDFQASFLAIQYMTTISFIAMYNNNKLVYKKPLKE